MGVDLNGFANSGSALEASVCSREGIQLNSRRSVITYSSRGMIFRY